MHYRFYKKLQNRKARKQEINNSNYQKALFSRRVSKHISYLKSTFRQVIHNSSSSKSLFLHIHIQQMLLEQDLSAPKGVKC